MLMWVCCKVSVGDIDRPGDKSVSPDRAQRDMEDHHHSDDQGKTKRLLRCLAFKIPEVKETRRGSDADESKGTTTEISEVGGEGDDPQESEMGGVLAEGGSVTEISKGNPTHKKAEDKGEIVEEEEEEEDLAEETRKIFRVNWQELRDRVVRKIIINSHYKGSSHDDVKESREEGKTTKRSAVGIATKEAAGVQESDKFEKSSVTKTNDSARSTLTDKRGKDEEEGEEREENKNGTGATSTP